MGNKTAGLYKKFTVIRNDGSSNPGGKHYNCEYFVLDLTHDKYANPALLAYAAACADEYPILAQELRNKADPYADLKKAEADPTKEIRCFDGEKWREWEVGWGNGTRWAWCFPPENYEIRDKPVVKTAYRRLMRWTSGNITYIVDSDKSKLNVDLQPPAGWLSPIEEFTYEDQP